MADEPSVNCALAEFCDHSVGPHSSIGASFVGRVSSLDSLSYFLSAEDTDPLLPHLGHEGIQKGTNSTIISFLSWLNLQRTLPLNGSNPLLKGCPSDHRVVGRD